MTLRNSGPPGTIGTVGTMVPRDGGAGVRRGPHDHQEAIIYMSRATPRKAKGRAARPNSPPAGLASGRPPRAPGPWSRRSRRRRRASQAASRPFSSFGWRAPGFCGRRWLPRRDHRGRWSRQNNEGSAPLAKRGVRHCQTMARPRPQAPSAWARLPRQLNRMWSRGPDTPTGRTSRLSPGRSQVSGYVGGSKLPRFSDEIALGGHVDQLRTFGRSDAGHDRGTGRALGPSLHRPMALPHLSGDRRGPMRNWRATSNESRNEAGVTASGAALDAMSARPNRKAVFEVRPQESMEIARAMRPRGLRTFVAGRTEGAAAPRARELLTLRNPALGKQHRRPPTWAQAQR